MNWPKAKERKEMTHRHSQIVLLLVALFISAAAADAGEAEASWKYLVERTTNQWDALTKKKEVHIDRALVYYGAGAEQAGGQVKGVPEVVYVDGNRNVRAKASYYESPILPFPGERFGLYTIPAGHPGYEPNEPMIATLVPKWAGFFPVKPEVELKKGLRWGSTWYLTIDDYRPEAMFPGTISHEVTGYKKKLGRRCAVIEYKITGEFKSVDHPELLTEKERLVYKGEWHLNGSDTAYFDPAEEIIVEKHQTLSYTSFSEIIQPLEAGKFDGVTTEKEALELVKSGLEDGSIGWVTTKDRATTVAISVSLIPEEAPKSRLLAYLLIIAGAGIVIAAVVLQRKKKGRPSGKR